MQKRWLAVVAGTLAALSVAGTAGAADPIFNIGVLHETRIVMDPSDWLALRRDFRSNQYYAANVAFDGEVLQQVGVRSRGKGSRSGEKPGLLIDINKYVSSQNLRGMKKVVLDNMIQDNTMLHEPLASAVFEAMGIPYAQIAYSRVTVNDEYWGVYLQMENIGKDFLRARFGEDGGNLYKYDYVDNWTFTERGGDWKAYIPLPMSPESPDNPDGTPLVNFVNTANSASSTGFAAAIAPYIDVNKFLTYLAVENAMAGQDGFVGLEGMNNFYMYQFAGTTKFTLIPWDEDTAFVSATWPIMKGMETNVLTRKLMADPANQKIYTDAVKAAAATAVNSAFLLPKLEAHYALIREAVLTDSKKPFTNDQFELGIQGMRGVVGARAADIAAQAP